MRHWPASNNDSFWAQSKSKSDAKLSQVVSQNIPHKMSVRPVKNKKRKKMSYNKGKKMLEGIHPKNRNKSVIRLNFVCPNNSLAASTWIAILSWEIQQTSNGKSVHDK